MDLLIYLSLSFESFRLKHLLRNFRLAKGSRRPCQILLLVPLLSITALPLHVYYRLTNGNLVVLRA